MRIREIHIDGFGHFADRSFGGISGPVTVFHGPNEAGKSTLLEFVRRVLYGFPDGRTGANQYRPHASGSHGGVLTIEDSYGLRYNIRRHHGRSGGPVTLTAERGEPMPDAELIRLLGGNPKYIFDRVFTFTLEELYASDLVSDDNVNDYIYSEGMGVSSLPEALRRIRREKDGLFRKGGSTQQIYHAANRLQSVDDSLREVADNAAEYARLSDELARANARLLELGERRDALERDQRRQLQLRSCWSDWVALDNAASRLSEIPTIESFPTDGVSRLDVVEQQIRSAQSSLSREQAQMELLAKQMEATSPADAVLESAEEIQGIARGSNSLRQSIKDLPERQAELRTRKDNLENMLRELGPAWDVERLERFDLSLEVRQEVAELGDRLRSADADLQRCEVDVTQAKQALGEAAEAEEEARGHLESAAAPALDEAQIRERRGVVRSARTLLGERERVRAQKLALDGQLASLGTAGAEGVPPLRFAAGVGIAIGIIVALLGFLTGGGMAALGTVGLVLAVAGVGLFLYTFWAGGAAGDRSTLLATVRRQRSEAEDVVEKCDLDLKELAVHLGLSEVTEAALSDAEEELEDETRRIQVRAQLKSALDRETGIRRMREGRLVDANQASADAADGQRDASQAWHSWLRSRELSDRFSPDSVDLLAGQIARARDQLGTVRDWEQRVAAIEQDLNEHYEAVHPHAETLGIVVSADDHRSVAAAADRLIALLEEARSTEQERRSLTDRLADRQQEVDAAREEIDLAQDDLKYLLELGGATDEEDFRRRQAMADERRQLEGNIRETNQRLAEASGPGLALELLFEALERTDSHSIEAEIERLEEELRVVEAEQQQTASERGSIETQLQQIEGEEASSRLRLERGQLMEEIRGHAAEWAKLTLAEALIEEARDKFERERQPDVIREAESFFRDTTGGRYQTVFSPIGERTIYVTESGGTSKQPSQLSRGTREQLFLSLRFGLIRELGRRTENLPVIVDEVLVNFDPERALRAASAFVRLGEENQVLVFTCHPGTVELFKEASAITRALTAARSGMNL